MEDISPVRNGLSDLKVSHSQSISVNHRALITRTLSKYPVEFALFREIIQNAADAGAEKIDISFETDRNISSETLSDVSKASVKRLTIKNNGIAFRPEDWSRLIEIAKGNPDETKIGAFGVGFYSVFSITDTPLVMSGKTAMSFFFKGDQLNYSKIELEHPRTWTTLDLPYKTRQPIPDLSAFTGFLAQSITFLNVSSLTFNVDSVNLFSLRKISSSPSSVTIPKEIDLYSSDRSMNIGTISMQSIQLNIKYLRITELDKSSEGTNIFSKGVKFFQNIITTENDPSSEISVSLFLRFFTSSIDIRNDPSFAKNIKETVMKPPPKKAIITIVALNRDEAGFSKVESAIASRILPQTHADARIFIGFATKQSPGLNSHFSIPQAIPTMERAALDMANAFVKTWNASLLQMAGITCRAVFGLEMRELSSRYKQNESEVTENVLHLMRRFDFYSSAPDRQVAELISMGFWFSAQSLPILTVKGVVESSQARLANSANFADTIPFVSEKILNNCPKFVETAKSLGFLTTVSLKDIKSDLEAHPCYPQKFADFLHWAFLNVETGIASWEEICALCKAVTITTHDKDIIRLKSINFFPGAMMKGYDIPVPQDCLPKSLEQLIVDLDLRKIGLKPLEPLALIRFLLQSQLFGSSDSLGKILDNDFSSKVLQCLAHEFFMCSEDTKEAIVRELRSKPVVPTDHGMRSPTDSYLRPIKLFPDVPSVRGLDDPLSLDFIVQLGVRKTIELRYIFDRLDAADERNRWSWLDLIDYLADQVSDMKREDFLLLSRVKIFESTKDEHLHKISSLYQPSTNLSQLNLPLLRYKEDWQPSSKRAALLYGIGLRKYPSASNLVRTAVETKSDSLRDRILRYFIEFYDKNGYSLNEDELLNSRFLPTDLPKTSSLQLSTPRGCYSDPKAEYLGLPILREDLRLEGWKFGVRDHPPASVMLEILGSLSPGDIKDASQMFGYLASRISDFSSSDLRAIGRMPIVPVKGRDSVRYQSPNRVFIESVNDGTDPVFRTFFDYVNMEKSAASFLRSCGARESPTKPDIGYLLAERAESVYNSVQGGDEYEALLVALNSGWSQICCDEKLVSLLRRQPILIGLSAKSGAEKDKDLSGRDRKLVSAKDVLIVDDVVVNNVFSDAICTCPQISELESFYRRLGVRQLSHVVKERVEVEKPLSYNHADLDALRKIILERLLLFLESSNRHQSRSFETLEKTLSLQMVSAIRIVRSLDWKPRKLAPREDQTTAHVVDNILYLVPSYDFFDVSLSLVKNVLVSPDPDSATILFSLLTSNLESLTRRGYNVKKILGSYERKKDSRWKQISVQEITENEEKPHPAVNTSAIETMESPTRQRELPGAFPSGPEQDISRTPVVKKSESKEGLRPTASPKDGERGDPNVLGKWRSFVKSFSNGLGHGETSGPVVRSSKSSRREEMDIRDATPISMSNLEKTLDAGVRRLQPFRMDAVSTPSRTAIHSQASDQLRHTCDFTVGQSLKMFATTKGGMNIFLDSSQSSLNSTQMAKAEKFSSLLWTLAQVFKCDLKALQIYFKADSISVAFNLRGSLFFNLSYFDDSVHVAMALSYWFPIVAHELAHNLETDHGQVHSFYSESYCQLYMLPLIDYINEIMAMSK